VLTWSQNTRTAMNTGELTELLEAKYQSFQSLYEAAIKEGLNQHNLENLETEWKAVNNALVVLKFMLSIPEDAEVVIEREQEVVEKLSGEEEQSIPVMKIVEEFEESIAEDVIPEEVAEQEQPSITEEVVEEIEETENSQEQEALVEEEHSTEPVAEEPQAEAEIEEEEVVEQVVEVVTETNEEAVDRNESLKQEDNSLADRLKKSPIPDLKSAIGLNQRFLFSNELFNGNMEAFNRTINEINHMESYEDAKRYLDVQLIPHYHWNPEGETVIEFQELIERRFM